MKERLRKPKRRLRRVVAGLLTAAMVVPSLLGTGLVVNAAEMDSEQTAVQTESDVNVANVEETTVSPKTEARAGTQNVTKVTSAEPEINDPFDVEVYKLSQYNDFYPEGDAELRASTFHVDVYAENNLTKAQIKDSSFVKTKVMSFDMTTKWDDVSQTHYALAHKDYISNFWSLHGSPLESYLLPQLNTLKIPYSTVVIQEIGLPEGYEGIGNVMYATPVGESDPNKSSDNMYIQHITPTQGAQGITEVAGMTIVNDHDEQKFGSVKVAKWDDQGKSKIPQGDANIWAEFEIYNHSENPVWVDVNQDGTIDEVKERFPVDQDCTNPIMRIRTDENGIASTPDRILPYGTYVIKEVATDDDYILNPWSKEFSIREDGQVVDYTGADSNAQNTVRRGGVSVTKFTEDFAETTPQTASGDSSLAGAEFTIYNVSKEAVYDVDTAQKYNTAKPEGDIVAVIKTNDSGFATTTANTLPIGTYVIKETKPSSGYLLNEVWYKQFSITYDGQMVDYRQVVVTDENDKSDTYAVGEKSIRGGLTVIKSDKDRIDTHVIQNKSELNVGQGDASLAGATFYIVNRSLNKVKVEGREYNPGAIVKELTTDEFGVATTDTDRDGVDYTLPYGTYEVYEASAPTGYFKDDDFRGTIYVRNHGSVEMAGSYSSNPVKEEVYRGGLKGIKMDGETDMRIPQGDATLAGAEISIYNRSTYSVYVDGKWYEPGEVCKVLTTDETGAYSTEIDKNGKSYSLPYGTYELRETKPSLGYLLNEDWSVTVTIHHDGADNGKVYDVESQPLEEQVIRGDVQLQKWDLELDKSESIGGPKRLEGITFEIYNASPNHVLVNGELVDSPNAVAQIVTHWNEELQAYTAETTGKALPYGTYTIKELPYSTKNKEVKANKYYMLTDGEPRTFTIREEGAVVTVDTDNQDLIWKNQVVRGDIEFRKIADGSQARMSTLWIVTNKETGERHVIAADENGEFLSSYEDGFPHTQDTNDNDKFLERIDAGEVINMSEANLEAGCWFGLGEFGTMAEPNDDLGALPYGNYTLSEVRTDTNYGFDLKQIDFKVYRNNVLVDIGTITNDHLTIGTTALDGQTGEHQGILDEVVTIIDTVSYEGLTPGNKYTMQGTLMNKETGGALYMTDADGNRVPVTAEKNFNPQKANGTVEVVFEVPKEVIAGFDVVVFEELLDVGIDYVIADHTDIDDDNQTVVYPEIKTTALSEVTGGNDAPSVGIVTIKDKVSYKGLIPGQKYVLKGVLMDATAGDEALDKDGNEIVSEVEFTPNREKGEVEVEFNFDASALAGHTTVVFENLYYNGKLIAVHADIEDEGQTIEFPEIKTTATTESTGNHMGIVTNPVVVNDEVKYSNLVVGRKYTMNGTLMDKSTGKELLDADGNPITASQEFVPTEKSGSVILRFEFDASLLAGKDIVAFESLKYEKIELAVHADIEDEEQTIHFPEIKTSAGYEDTKEHEGLAKEKTTIVDVVSYKNLNPGEEYTMTGTLMDKSANAPVLDKDGNPITGSTTFTPEKSSGTVEVKFTFDATDYEGHTFVVFETLLYKEYELTHHEDIDDEDQSVKFPKIGTTLTDKDSSFHEVAADSKVTLVDTVTYENLTPGTSYEVTGTLMDKKTGEALGGVESVTKEFTPEEANGTVDITFTFSTKGLENKTLVAFEEVSVKGCVIAEHKDLEDEGQTVHIPEIHTTATDADTGTNEGLADTETKLIDRVEYKNLIPGHSYRVSGTLMNKDTGEPILDRDGKTLVSTVGFVAEKANGYVDVEFIFDSSILAGTDVVAFEELYREEVKLGVHADIEDDNQTVHYPDIHTTAVYDKNGFNEGLAGKEVTIVDTVHYENLRPGKTYTVEGTLMDKSTGKEITTVVKDDEGKETEVPVTASTTFEPKESDGEVDVVFTFDASHFEGQTVVCFETLYADKKVVAVHTDIEDEDQSVHFPEIHTTLKDEVTGLHETNPTTEVTLVDTVEYRNLTPGKTYTMDGTLMNKETGEPVVDADGKEVVASVEFTPEEPNGTVDIVFVLNASDLAGKSVVAFESLKHDGIEVGVHADIEDEEQTVHFPYFHTLLYKFGGETTDKELFVGEAFSLTDAVYYENLTVGNQYRLVGTLMDKETGEPLKDAEGNLITAQGEFTAEESSGETAIHYLFDGRELGGKELVSFVKLYGVVTEIGDIDYIYEDDSEQLEVVGDAVDESEKEPVGMKSWAVRKDVLLYAAEDINDADETISVLTPEIGTTALSKLTNSHMLESGDKVTIVDTVEYKNLNPGTVYVMKGILMDKETGEAFLMDGASVESETEFTAENDMADTEVTDSEDVSDAESEKDEVQDAEDEDAVTETDEATEVSEEEEAVVEDDATSEESTEQTVISSEEFVPEKSHGTVEVEFVVNTKDLAGKTLVVFEAVSDGDVTIATHEDIEDEDQTVYVLKIGTKATAEDGRSKTVGMNPDTVIIDTVSYENLVPGQKYLMTGQMMNKSTNSAVGNPVTVEFTPKESSGEVDVRMVLDTTGLKGETLVAFETIMDENGHELGSHKDINDEDQAVVVQTITNVQTGIQTYAGLVAAIAVALLVLVAGGAGVVVYRRRRMM